MNEIINVQHSFTEDQIELIKKTVAKSANLNTDEFKLFLHVANRSGLDPLAKQIYVQKRGSNLIFITAIDGYRLIASRTGEHAGTDDAIFEYDAENYMVKATVSVYRNVKSVIGKFTATAYWSEYNPESNPMWKKMPHTMLGKCAEALALRKAFPNELSGTYTKEEMDQADEPEKVETKPVMKTIVAEIEKPIVDKPKVVFTNDLRESLNYKLTFTKQSGMTLGQVLDKFGAEHIQQQCNRIWHHFDVEKMELSPEAKEYIHHADAVIKSSGGFFVHPKLVHHE